MAYHNRSSIQAPTVIAKPLLVAVILALVGCGSAPKVPVQPEEQPKAPKIEPLPDHSELPALGFWQYKIVEIAKSEWVYFGQQIVEIDGNRESITQVGIWEDEDDGHRGFDPNNPESYIVFSLAQSAYQESSLKFAGKVESQFKTRLGRKSHGVKQAGFLVLWRTAMPSVLIEVGFLTNKKEEKFLGGVEGQELIASGIYRAFKDYKAQVEAIN